MKNLIRLFAIVAVLASLNPLFAKGKAMPEGTINLNTATAEQLMLLPGIGQSKADAIIAYRQNHPFKAVAELTEVKGIGPKMLEKLQPHLTVDGNAASAPQASAQPAKK
jgi:competence protein ComEA